MTKRARWMHPSVRRYASAPTLSDPQADLDDLAASAASSNASPCFCGPQPERDGLTAKEWHTACVVGIAQFLLDCYDGESRVNSRTFWHLRFHLAGAR